MAYQRKTHDVWYLWVNYGQGYELELIEETKGEAKLRLREYRENCPQYPCYISMHRERIEKDD